MSQIEELHSRITAAMARIGTGVETLAQTGGAADAGLVDALAEEKLANAQLEERLRGIKAKHDAELDLLRAELDQPGEAEKLQAELAAQADAMARLDVDLQRLRQANEQLRESNATLRTANEAGVGEPHLINKAMLAELEALRAARAVDTAEASAVLARLEPLLADAAIQANGEGA